MQILEFIGTAAGAAIFGGACAIIGGVLGPGIGSFIAHRFSRKEKRYESRDARIAELERDNADLKSRLERYEAVERPKNGDYYILKATGETICHTCWGGERKAIRVREENGTGYYMCDRCKGRGVYDSKRIKELDADREASNRDLTNYFSDLKRR